jgi:anti-sigma B factor antagonist
VALTIDHRVSGDVVILRAKGCLTRGDESDSLTQAIRGVLGEGNRKILLNLGEVAYIDSAGLGALLSAYTAVGSFGSALKLSGIREPNQKLFRLSRVDTIFEIVQSEDDALKGDWPSPRAR